MSSAPESQNEFPMSSKHLACERIFMEAKMFRSGSDFDFLLHQSKGEVLPFDYFVKKLKK